MNYFKKIKSLNKSMNNIINKFCDYSEERQKLYRKETDNKKVKEEDYKKTQNKIQILILLIGIIILYIFKSYLENYLDKLENNTTDKPPIDILNIIKEKKAKLQEYQLLEENITEENNISILNISNNNTT